MTNFLNASNRVMGVLIPILGLLTLVTLITPPSTTIVSGAYVYQRPTKPKLLYQPRPNQNGQNGILVDPRQESNPSRSLSHELDEFFDENYDPTKTKGNSFSQIPIPCNYGGAKATNYQPCRVNLTRIHPECSKSNRYGYAEGKPCVLLRFERVEYYTPSIYNQEFLDYTATKNGMPQWLSTKAKDLISQNEDYEDTVWISCEGVGPADRQALGQLKYYSVGFTNQEFPGIPAYYFPYTNNQNQYRDPFVFVKFENVQKHVPINVKCSPWAIDLSPALESVTFQIEVD